MHSRSKFPVAAATPLGARSFRPKGALSTRSFSAMGGLSDDERQPLGGGKAAHGCGPSLVRVIVIESVIYLLWAILEIVNVILKVLELMYRPFDACAGLLAPNDSPKHVVIVGASFGGLAAQRELAGRRDVKVTLIDFKSYFEYTPGVPRSPRAQPRAQQQALALSPSPKPASASHRRSAAS